MPEDNSNIEVRLAKFETKLDYVIAEIKELKDGFAHRLERVEVQKLQAADFISHKKDEFVPLEVRVGQLEEWKWKIVAAALVGGAAADLAIRFLIK